ncbi:hypothetical protein B0T25DRAFT_562339 [Lasiosphaeria hispida]|uniref:DNA2/NAM7 helicase-like C-terminal domain-containing protein n=1 Tax=Lasiosphaeria hispida TaxID=260671 RepID=A0AAJ0MK33_9PEZI|nr:hypothetical protein B0T25DRAFT_562339 [Lasiosphaeria hispida]
MERAAANSAIAHQLLLPTQYLLAWLWGVTADHEASGELTTTGLIVSDMCNKEAIEVGKSFWKSQRLCHGTSHQAPERPELHAAAAASQQQARNDHDPSSKQRSGAPTIDTALGQETDFVFIDMVREYPSAHLDNPKRLCVGITRARARPR